MCVSWTMSCHNCHYITGHDRACVYYSETTESEISELRQQVETLTERLERLTERFETFEQKVTDREDAEYWRRMQGG